MFKNSMKIEACLVALLSFMFLTTMVFGQGGGASLTGTIQDTSGGVVAGASVVARNVDTGVETRTTSSDRGLYTFPSLPVGTYALTVEAPGFSTYSRSDVRLNVGAQARMDVTLAVAGSVTEIAVSGTTESVILEAGSSTGTVMQEEMLASIPLLSGSVMDLINIMGGVTPATDPVFGAASQTFAGVAGSMINVTRDGMSVSEVRNPTGVAANTNINTEMIGEFRMVLSPVDAEMGRGAGQVQMTTRSGSNAFHGSAVWNNQNTVLDARDFSAKRSNNPASWRNLNNYLLTASGPIVKNRTFFFATWEHQIARDKVAANLRVLTPCARKGIYRYISNWNPAAVSAESTFNPGSALTLQSVHPDGTPYLGGDGKLFYNVNDPLRQPENARQFAAGELGLRVESVFGQMNPLVKDALLADQGPTGVYGNCEDINFIPATTAGYQGAYGTNTDGLYGQYKGMNFLQPGSYWGGDFATNGVYRNAYDPTGFVSRFTYGADYEFGRVEMPPVTNYDIGDGLNNAGFRWHNPRVGDGGSIYGTGGDPDRKSITFKIDHNVNNDHRLSGTYTYETYYVDDGYRQWPESFGGYGASITRQPQNLAVSLTSTLRPTLLNEARFGLSLSKTWTRTAYDNLRNGENGEKVRSMVEALLPREWANGEIPHVGVGDGAFMFHSDPTGSGASASHPYGSRGNISTTWGGSDPRWTIADTVTWMKGAHSFKGGVEYRRQSSQQDFSGNRDFGGAGGYADHAAVFGGLAADAGTRRSGILSAYTTRGDYWTDIAAGSWDGFMNFYTGNYGNAWGLMSYFAGTVGRMSQYFYGVPDSSSSTGSRWNRPYDAEKEFTFTLANQEFSLFFKDDWRVNNNLTLNLGVRYEYYGVPYARDGKTIKMKGISSESVFGISKSDWNNWMQNREYVSAGAASINGNVISLPSRPGRVTEFEYVGPGSSNPDVMAWSRDVNNIAPHLGFAWQLPWLGRGQTTLRGGWSMSYSPVDNFNQYGIYVGDLGGVSRLENFRGVTTNDSWNQLNGGGTSATHTSQYYMDLTDLRTLLPNGGYLEPSSSVLPLMLKEVGEVNGFATAIDENVRSPYVHSLNLSLTRNFGRALTVDVRYIGTLARNQLVNQNLNQSNYIQTGLMQELVKVRNGGESGLINSLIPNGTLATVYLPGTFNPDLAATGSEQIRSAAGVATGAGAAANTSANLATGNFSGIVSTLTTTNGNLTLPGGITGTTAGLLSRAGCLPEDRANPNGDMADHVNNPCLRGTPWNYFHTNPQYGSASIYYNEALTNYHSMQAQVTLRPTHGVNLQATYTWSRNLSDTGWSNYLGERDYLLTGQHRSHTLNTYGTWELPFGERGFLFRDASGAFKKAIEGWQLNWVTTMSSGSPSSVTGANTLWGNSYPNLVRSDLWDEKSGKAAWSDSFVDGWYYGSRYAKTVDYNICNSDEMTSALFSANCMYLDTGATSVTRNQYIPRGTAPRVLTLASDEVNPYTGEVLPARYGSLEEALRYDPNARMEMDSAGNYTLMPSVVVFRSAYQADYNPADPGAYLGNYKANRVTGQGRFSFDLAMLKSVEFMEGKRFEIRIDAQNILNHPTPTNGTASSYGGRFQSLNNPSFAINGTGAFGRLSTKGGHRTFQTKLTLRF